MATVLTLTKSSLGVKWSRPLEYVLQMLRNGDYSVSITKKKSKRSVSQNALMWMWFRCIAKDKGMAVKDVHDLYCSRFLKRPVVDETGEVIVVTGNTSSLTTKAFAEFLDQVYIYAIEDGVRLLLPEDEYWEEFYKDFEDDYIR